MATTQAARSASEKAVVNVHNEKPVHLVLAKDLAKSIRSGHPWLYSAAFDKLPQAAPGSIALVKNKAGDIIAKGIYDPSSPIPFRSMAVMKERLDNGLVSARLNRAALLRARLFPDPEVTSGFRLVNGEGDGLPGLVCDIYNTAAVLKLDGAGPQAFYNIEGIADWLMSTYPQLKTVFLKYRSGSEERGRLIAGDFPHAPIVFKENGAIYQVDVVQGQKTGFFLDQRNNRALVGRLCSSSSKQGKSSKAPGVRMLNVFGYTGGFSIYAGRAGASHVTTVDLAPKAIEFAEANWELNGLQEHKHNAVTTDAFDFLERASKGSDKWDVVVVDPPSFAPNKQSVEKAKSSYERVFSLAAQCVAQDGIICMASCSSHIDTQMFADICSAALARARRRGYVLTVGGQPEDHPFPAAAEELRYLKFNAFQLEG